MTSCNNYLLQSAEDGKPDAQFQLGLYFQGPGIATNFAEAAVWFEKAAEQGHISAQVNLASLYTSGKGVEQDLELAFRWYREAASQGGEVEQDMIGELYSRGQGVRQNKMEAAKWYRMSADQGLCTAQRKLAECYMNGEGVPKDEIEAYAYFNLAAVQLEPARKKIAELEEILPMAARLKAQQRSRQIQKQVDATWAKKRKQQNK